jgi:hypothetical protein
MENVLTKTKKTSFAKKSPKSLNVLTSSDLINQHNHEHKKEGGACTVLGCGCPEFKDNGGTCWNLNSSGGTCNHLASDHS